jgi:hypothetical protein
MHTLEVENLQKIVSGSKEGQRTRCPRCSEIMDSDFRDHYFLCSKCEDVYRKSTSSGLEKITVEPAEDVSSYPEVVLMAHPPFCDCEIKEYFKSCISHLGPEYCEKHNVISVGGMFEPKHLENIDKIAIEIITHETLHWILGVTVGEPASHWLDQSSVQEALGDFLNSDEKTE